MTKVRINKEIKSKINSKKDEIEFDFRGVQTPNPRLQGKTPMWLYTRNPISRKLKPNKQWWEKKRGKR